MLTLKNILKNNKLIQNSRIIIQERLDDDSYEYTTIVDNSSDFIISNHKNLLNRMVISISPLETDPVKFNIEDRRADNLAVCILIRKINIHDFIPKLRIRVCDIPYVIKRCFDKYYINEWFGEHDELLNSVDADTIFRAHGIYDIQKHHAYAINSLMIYTKHTANRYNHPIFRIYASYKVNDDFSKLSRMIDRSLVFTLSKNPKPLQHKDYNTLAKTLKGNILPKSVIDELVAFVSDNYDAFIDAWNTDIRGYNTHKYGYNPKDLDISEVNFSVFDCLVD